MSGSEEVWDNLAPHEKEALAKAESRFRKGLDVDNPYSALELKSSKNIKGTEFACYIDGDRLVFFSEKNRFKGLIQMAEQIWLPDWPDVCRLAVKIADDNSAEPDEDEAWELESFGFRLEGDTISLGHHGLPSPASMFLSPVLFYQFLEFINDNLTGQAGYKSYAEQTQLSQCVRKWEQTDDAK